MCGVNGKRRHYHLNPDRKGFGHNLPTMVGILLILVTTISISYSFPVSAILNPQLAGAAAIPPAHTSVKVQHTSSSQLMHLQFFPSNSLYAVSIFKIARPHCKSHLFPLIHLSRKIHLMP